MATRQTWVERVSGWRESGLTSERFSEGRGFRSNALRHWAWKLGKTKRRRSKAMVRFARVVRAPAPTAGRTTRSAPEPVDDGGVAVEIGPARIIVQAGFDRATLAALLDVLAARGGTR